MGAMLRLNLSLFGHPRLGLTNGERVPLRSKKGTALLALLATAEKGERSRTWLQQKLWGSRDVHQAQASLRRELANLRKLVPLDLDWLVSDNHSVRIDLDLVDVDMRGPAKDAPQGEFLEGLDIPGEEDFEDWLREVRAQFSQTQASGRFDKGGRDDIAGGRLRGPVRAGADFSPFAQALIPVAEPAELRPVLAILPVRGLFTSQTEEPFLQAVTRLLVSSVTRLRWLPVLTASVADDSIYGAIGPEDAKAQANARYVLESELVRSGSQAILSFTLLEMPLRTVLWSDSEPVAPTFDIHEIEQVLFRAVNLLSARFDRCEQHRVMARKPDPANLADAVWRIRYHLQKFTREDMATAAQLLDQAFELDPHHAELAMLRANHVIWDHWLRRVPVEKCDGLVPLARAAVRADPADARGPLFMGVLETWRRNTEHAIRYLERSCELNPCFPAAFTHLGAAYYLNGKPERSIEPLERSLYLSPMDPFRFFILGELGTARLLLGEHAEALRIAREVQLTHPNYVLAHILETNALVGLGEMERARAAWSRLLADRPDLYEGMLAWIPFRETSWLQRLRQGCDLVSADWQKPRLAAG